MKKRRHSPVPTDKETVSVFCDAIDFCSRPVDPAAVRAAGSPAAGRGRTVRRPRRSRPPGRDETGRRRAAARPAGPGHRSAADAARPPHRAADFGGLPDAGRRTPVLPAGRPGRPDRHLRAGHGGPERPEDPEHRLRRTPHGGPRRGCRGRSGHPPLGQPRRTAPGAPAALRLSRRRRAHLEPRLPAPLGRPHRPLVRRPGRPALGDPARRPPAGRPGDGLARRSAGRELGLRDRPERRGPGDPRVPGRGTHPARPHPGHRGVRGPGDAAARRRGRARLPGVPRRLRALAGTPVRRRTPAPHRRAAGRPVRRPPRPGRATGRPAHRALSEQVRRAPRGHAARSVVGRLVPPADRRVRGAHRRGRPQQRDAARAARRVGRGRRRGPPPAAGGGRARQHQPGRGRAVHQPVGPHPPHPPARTPARRKAAAAQLARDRPDRAHTAVPDPAGRLRGRAVRGGRRLLERQPAGSTRGRGGRQRPAPRVPRTAGRDRAGPAGGRAGPRHRTPHRRRPVRVSARRAPRSRTSRTIR